MFEKWGLDFAVVGRVTDTGRMVVRHGGGVVADLPVAPVSGASPVYERPYEVPAPRRALRRDGPARPGPPTRCCACSARPTSPPSAGSGSSTTTP